MRLADEVLVYKCLTLLEPLPFPQCNVEGAPMMLVGEQDGGAGRFFIIGA